MDEPRYSDPGRLSTEEAEAVARNAGTVGAATLASRVLGLARDVVLASQLETRATDAFFIAFMIPNLFRRLIGEGALTVAFVPIFTGWLRRSREQAREVFNATWTASACVGLLIAALGIGLAEPLVRLFAPGFALEPGKLELCAELLRLCFPYILLLTLVAVAMGALNAVGHFLAPALAPVLLNLCLIAAALGAPLWLDRPVLALGGAVLVAGVLQVAIHVPVLRRHGLAPRPRFDPGHPALRRLGIVMAPAVVGASVYQFNILIVRFLSSFEGDGAVSYLYYADRMLEFPLGVFVFALGTASLPSFSRLVKDGDRDGLRRTFTDTLALALALALPSTMGLISLRVPLMGSLFGWNPELFGPAAISGSSMALCAYALGLVPITVSRICVGLCIAHENTRTPAWGAGLSLATNALCCLLLVGPLPSGGLPDGLVALQHRLALFDLSYVGLALSTSIAALANAGFLLAACRLRYGRLFAPGSAARVGWLLLATLASFGLVEAALWLVGPPTPGTPALLALGLYVGAGALGYLAALFALRSPELRALVALVRRQRSVEPPRAP